MGAGFLELLAQPRHAAIDILRLAPDRADRPGLMRDRQLVDADPGQGGEALRDPLADDSDQIRMLERVRHEREIRHGYGAPPQEALRGERYVDEFRRVMRDMEMRAGDEELDRQTILEMMGVAIVDADAAFFVKRGAEIALRDANEPAEREIENALVDAIERGGLSRRDDVERDARRVPAQRRNRRREREIAIVAGGDGEQPRRGFRREILFRMGERRAQALQRIADRPGELERARRRAHLLRRAHEKLVTEQ